MSQLQQPLSLPFSRIIFISVLSLLFSSLFVTCDIVNLQLINRREPTPPTYYSTPHTALPQITGLRSYRPQATGYRTFRLQSLKTNLLRSSADALQLAPQFLSNPTLVFGQFLFVFGSLSPSPKTKSLTKDLVVRIQLLYIKVCHCQLLPVGLRLGILFTVTSTGSSFLPLSLSDIAIYPFFTFN